VLAEIGYHPDTDQRIWWALAGEQTEDSAVDKPRGACPECGREFRLTKSGRVPAHVHAHLLGSSHLQPDGGRCAGSGQKPKES
jgi:hypothetical protein